MFSFNKELLLRGIQKILYKGMINYRKFLRPELKKQVLRFTLKNGVLRLYKYGEIGSPEKPRLWVRQHMTLLEVFKIYPHFILNIILHRITCKIDHTLAYKYSSNY
jgi:hypothetical protein